MSANGISTLTTNGYADKEKRQKAKLDLAAAKRNDTYDITQLPTQWDFDNLSNKNILIDNPNALGLLIGRPWLRSTTSIYALLVNGVTYEPPLTFDFTEEYYRTNSAQTTFDSAMTFSRSGNATMVDSDGLLKWAPHNLLTYSEQFDNATWSKSGILPFGSGSTANSAIAPNGTMTADFICEDTSTGYHYIRCTGIAVGVNVTFSVYVKSAGREYAYIYSAANTASGLDCRVNLTNGAVTNNAVGTVVTTENAGSGWWRVQMSMTGAYAGPVAFFAVVGPANGAGAGIPSYTGDGTSGIYIWGAHLYRSDLGGMVNNPDTGNSYVPTTTAARYLPRRGHHVFNGVEWVNEGLLVENKLLPDGITRSRTNLVAQSNNFASWLVVFTTVAQNATSPDGGATAWTLTDDGLGGGSSNCYVQWNAIPVTATSSYTASLYVKAANNSVIEIETANDDGVRGGSFNVSTQTFTPIASEVGRITPEGNGWYRCSVTWTTGADTNIALRVSFPSITRDGTNTILIYGAQLEAGSIHTSYIPTSGATATRAADAITVPAAKLPWPTPTFNVEVAASSWTGVGWNTFTTDGTTFAGNKTTAGGTAIAYSDVVVPAALGEEVYIEVDFLPGTNTETKIGLSSTTNARSTTVVVNPSAGGTFGVYVNTNILSGTFNVYVSTTQLGTLSVLAARAKTVRRNLSMQMQGQITYADTGNANEVVFSLWQKDSVNFIHHRMSTISTRTGAVIFLQRESFSGQELIESLAVQYLPGINVPYNIASRHGSTFLNGAVDGTALTADTTPAALPNLSATDLQIAYDYMGTISKFRMWPDDLGDTGITEAST